VISRPRVKCFEKLIYHSFSHANGVINFFWSPNGLSLTRKIVLFTYFFSVLVAFGDQKKFFKKKYPPGGGVQKNCTPSTSPEQKSTPEWGGTSGVPPYGGGVLEALFSDQFFSRTPPQGVRLAAFPLEKIIPRWDFSYPLWGGNIGRTTPPHHHHGGVPAPGPVHICAPLRFFDLTLHRKEIFSISFFKRKLLCWRTY